jgi:3-deoxy-7-phosphoheptulonate synthase
MVVVVRADATPEQRAQIDKAVESARGRAALVYRRLGAVDVVLAPGTIFTSNLRASLARLPGVLRVVAETPAYPLACRAVFPERTTVRVGNAVIGGPEPVIIAGPCSVESEAQIYEAARAARDAGAHLLRGGAFKPRTSPYSFQGLGLAGVRLLAGAGASVGLPVVTEVMEPGLVEAVAEHADMLQVGSRNMQNYPLLRAVGQSRRPVLLKRGFAATIEEWLLAAEYILSEGNPNVILCERGVRGFDPSTRNLLDLACVPLLRELTHLPVLVDPSHATGRRDLVPPMGVAAIAAGADGLLVEMRPRPDEALSDAEQTIDPETLARLVRQSLAVRSLLSVAEAEPPAAQLVGSGEH